MLHLTVSSFSSSVGLTTHAATMAKTPGRWEFENACSTHFNCDGGAESLEAITPELFAKVQAHLDAKGFRGVTEDAIRTYIKRANFFEESLASDDEYDGLEEAMSTYDAKGRGVGTGASVVTAEARRNDTVCVMFAPRFNDYYADEVSKVKVALDKVSGAPTSEEMSKGNQVVLDVVDGNRRVKADLKAALTKTATGFRLDAAIDHGHAKYPEFYAIVTLRPQDEAPRPQKRPAEGDVAAVPAKKVCDDMIPEHIYRQYEQFRLDGLENALRFFAYNPHYEKWAPWIMGSGNYARAQALYEQN